MYNYFNCQYGNDLLKILSKIDNDSKVARSVFKSKNEKLILKFLGYNETLTLYNDDYYIDHYMKWISSKICEKIEIWKNLKIWEYIDEYITDEKDIMKALLTQVDYEAMTTLHRALLTTNEKVIFKIFEYIEKNLGNDKNRMQALLTQVDCEAMTTLHRALLTRNEKVIFKIFEYIEKNLGNDKNRMQVLLTQTDYKSRTVLHSAFRINKTEVIIRILEYTKQYLSKNEIEMKKFTYTNRYIWF